MLTAAAKAAPRDGGPRLLHAVERGTLAGERAGSGVESLPAEAQSAVADARGR